MSAPPIRAVFFDVDFTLLRPGPRFEGAGYAEVCAAHGVAVDAARFEAAVTRALPLLDDHGDPVYDHGVFIRYTAAIIEHMGGRGRGGDGGGDRDLRRLGLEPPFRSLRRRPRRRCRCSPPAASGSA